MTHTGSESSSEIESGSPPEEGPSTGLSLSAYPGVRTFLTINAATLLYALSAVSILYGIARLFGPLMANDSGLREALPFILALAGYELALLGVLLLVVLYCRVTDDAISLTALVALFMIVSAIALGVFANRDSEYAVPLGIAVWVLAAAKLLMLRGWICVPFTRTALTGVLLVLGWIFLSAPLLASHFEGEVAMNAADRDPWLWTWPVLLAAGGLVLVGFAVRRPDSTQSDPVPFLRTSSMAIIFALILLVGAGTHSYLLAYMFHMQREFGDFVPWLTIVAFLGAELPRQSRGQAPAVETMLYGVPLVLWGIALHGNHVVVSLDSGPGLLLYPAVALGATAVYLGCLGWVRGRNGFLCLALVYAIGALLAAGYAPSDPGTLNWHWAGGALASAVLLAGWLRRNAYLCWFSVVVVSVGLTTFEPVEAYCRAHDLSEVALAAGCYGIGTLLLYLVFVPGLSPGFAVVAAGSVILFGLDFFPDAHGGAAVIMVLVFTVLCAGVYLRTRDVPVVGLVAASSLYGLYEASAAILFWRFVILGFVLLMIGAAASLIKGRAWWTGAATTPPAPASRLSAPRNGDP